MMEEKVIPVASSCNRWLKKVKSSQSGETSYKSCFIMNPKVQGIDKPDGRFVRVGFKKGKVDILSLSGRKYFFTYEKRETKVENPLGEETLYKFDSKKRLSSIEHLKDGRPIRQDMFYWTEQGTLLAKRIKLRDQYFQSSVFSYDPKGNVIKKAVYGNLTGEKPDSFSSPIGEFDTDSYSTSYTYTDDKMNLLASQSTPVGWTITYDYLPKTNLRTSVLQSYQGKIQERTFSSYDDNGEVRFQIEDDGSATNANDMKDVTYRRIKRISRETANWMSPSFGKPKQIDEYFFSNGKTTWLTKKFYSYDVQGREYSVMCAGGNGVFCYNTSKSYDSFGRVNSETNPLYKTLFSYNESGQKIREEVVKSGKITHYSYDGSGWLITKKEEHDSGETFETTYVYDAMGHLIQENDPYGQQTTYSYDRLGNQIEKFIASDGAVYKKEFNVLNQVTSETDPNGNTTFYSYNIYGSKTKIIYPDGSIERLVYHTNGWLKQHWKINGTSIQYAYDPKGRVIEESTLDINGEVLKSETFAYKSSLLTEKVDAMGLKTTYQYDGAGRKIQEICGSKITSYTYDDFNRVATIVYPLGATELFTYDFLDRVISKTKKDSQGKVYAKEIISYDLQGNEIERKCLKKDDEFITYLSKYGSDNRILFREDPFGNRTTYEYDHHHINEKGQNVLSCKITDALGRITIRVNDTYSRPAREDIFENDKLGSRIDYVYDLAGNKIETKISVYADGEKVRDYWITSTYNSRGLLASETEMPEGKTTTYIYTPQRLLAKKIKPDGVAVIYSYDALGRKIAIRSDDIHYTYTYDLHDNPVEAYNVIDKTLHRMSYDLQSNLIEEELHNGAIMTFAYDEQNRLTGIMLPDGSSIKYIYDAFNLVKVERNNALGELTYACSCPDYDLCCNRLQDVSPAGSISYTFDKKNRKIGIDSQYWSSHSEAFDAVDNLLSITQNDPSGDIKIDFAYDRFDHMIKDEKNSYNYDSLGNCLKKNEDVYVVNDLNQLTNNYVSLFTYDPNGNLTSQTDPYITYTYDALNRLESDGEARFSYDGFDRCICIKDANGKKQLLYQGPQEIGALVNGQLQELRVVHPKALQETTFAIEIDRTPYFPIQDASHNIVALRTENGAIAQYSRFSPFGEESPFGDTLLPNPWRFANRRNIKGLSLFHKRFYNPCIMRWQSSDPLGFEDGLNLYAFVHNNPLRYYDHDGQLVIIIPIFTWAFGGAAVGTAAAGTAVAATAATATVTFVTVDALSVAVAGALLTGAVTTINKVYDNRCDKENSDEEKKEDGKFYPDRDLPRTPDGVDIPETDAEHTQLGTGGEGSNKYRQAREFDKYGRPVRDIDFTDHRRPQNHPNPHQHDWLENPTGGSRIRDKPKPLTDWNYQ